MGNANAPATEAESSPPPSPSPAKEEQGKLIGGRYRLEEKMLGSGAFAVVRPRARPRGYLRFSR